MRFNFSHLHGIVKGGDYLFCYLFTEYILCRDRNVRTGGCRWEHSDGSVPTGGCDQKGERGVIVCFAGCLKTTYLYGDGIMQTVAC